MEAWAHRVRVLGKISQQHPQSTYAVLGMSLQLEWQYLQITVPEVGTLMSTIEEAIREKFFPALFGGEEINSKFRQILGHSVKHGGLVIPNARLSAEIAYNTSKADSGELVDYILGGSALNYVGHRACVCKASLAAREAKMHIKLVELVRRKELAGDQERNRLYSATSNGAWLISLLHRLNVT